MPDVAADGWGWFESAISPEPGDTVRQSFERAFATDAGRQVLAHLRRATVERRTPPEASEAVLRHLEGQRALVQLIERLGAPSHAVIFGHD
jgi:hypothetical protein